MRKADMTSGAVLIGLGAVVATGTLSLPYWSDVTPGPAFAARWVSVISVLLGGLLVWQAFSRAEDFPIEWPDHAGAMSVVRTSSLLWSFCLALPFAGFALAGAVFMMAMLMWVQRRPLWPSVLATAITIGAGHAIFIKWLGIKLPLGPFGA